MRYLNSRFNLPYKITHMIIYGQTGSGKSQTTKSCAERAFLRGNTKVLDLYSGGAEEGCYYALESKHPFWDDREYSYKKEVTKKMEFPVNCILPVSKKMPKNIPDIFTPFTIPINSISENDLKAVLGGDLTKSEIALWRRIAPKITKKTTLIDILNLMIDAKTSEKKDERIPGVSAHGISSVYNVFSAFEKQQLFTSKLNPLSLDLLSELKNKGVITSLVLKYFPEEHWGFIINYFIHKVYDYVLQGKIKHNVIIIMREAGDFLEGLSDSPQEQAVKRGIIHVLRKGRKHRLFFWLDNQTPMNLDVIKTQFPIKICHFVDNTEELKNSLGDLGSMLLNREDYTKLMSFGPGKCFILTHSGLFNPQMLPPLSRMSGEEGNDFFTIWRNEKGSRFINISEKLSIINHEYTESKQRWKDVLENRKAKAREKKQLIKDQKEELKNKKEEEKTRKKLQKVQEKSLQSVIKKESVIKVEKIRSYQNKPREKEIDISKLRVS